MKWNKAQLLCILIILLLLVHKITLSVLCKRSPGPGLCRIKVRKKVALSELRNRSQKAFLHVLLRATCGYMLNDQTIIHGENVPVHWWPWQGYLQGKNNMCGAILISSEWVLSAAHCYDHSKFVVLGTASIHEVWKNPNVQFKLVSREIVHENYHTYDLQNDIMMIKFKTPVKFTDFVSPVCLPTSSQVFNATDVCYTTGWGRDKIGNISHAPTWLQQIRVTVDHDLQCQMEWNGNRAKVGPRQMCIKQWRNSDYGPCQGDSGGPLSCKQNGIYYVAGISSFASSTGPAGNCRGTKPDTFTKVSAYIDWILDKMARF